MRISGVAGDENFPDGLLRIDDGVGADADWALAWEAPGATGVGVVVLHGHGSHGDQLFTRPDLKPWGKFLRDNRCGILAPNLRGNAWMCPEAAADLQRLIAAMRRQFGWRKIILASGSMGGTGNLIYAMLHPEEVDAVIALGAASDLAEYAAWCVQQQKPVCREIATAIRTGYHDDAELLARHSVCRHAAKLTMPVWLLHGDADTIIPVAEARRLAGLLAEKPDFHYRQIAHGEHDAPLAFFAECVAQALAAI